MIENQPNFHGPRITDCIINAVRTETNSKPKMFSSTGINILHQMKYAVQYRAW